jgi:hypothetical protein
MLTLQVIEKQVKYNKMDLVFVFSRKVRVAAGLLGNLLITRAANRTGHEIKRVTCKFIDPCA